MPFVRTVWPTIIELPGFVRDVAGVLSPAECMELGVYLAKQPQCGDVIPGGKGLRKVRWMARQRGKRGGARVIYFYRMPDESIFFDGGLRQIRTGRHDAGQETGAGRDGRGACGRW